MILIDDREPSDVGRHLSPYGVAHSYVRLDFGDCCFTASGFRDSLIGFERKRVTDLIASMLDRRLSGHQLSGMARTYDRINLVIEGLWRPTRAGAIEHMTGNAWRPIYHLSQGVSYRQVDSYLQSLAEAGVHVWRTQSTLETASLYVSRWHWWQKDYELHRSHDQIYSRDPAGSHKASAVVVRSETPDNVCVLAAQIPGIDAKAWDVSKHFDSPFALMSADEREWRQIVWTDRKGNHRRFGKDTAREIVAWCRSRRVG